MYEELIKQLRNRRICIQSGGNLEKDYPLMRVAADTIEELLAWHNADVRELERQKHLIKNMLIENMRPLVQGKWIDTDNYYQRWKCSVCGNHTRDAEPNYCPNCGANMSCLQNANNLKEMKEQT